ncbi:uncharacterized protein Nmag_2316 [Natrialba magadii ATCC 43099]|uniref:DUF8119 domain-containing protein n=1 Tax=Natrialba magadii (strain ATCC 43099 / DSM 3394 / CCM 3739 / CIP 104546 / IAM 13178 / JCM 8861 / NBRC 102185 / NCIMB 2190 / MS3) TaxID=547559 RepID=D3SWZ7_NATMM|nr:hypothetical protein [Natrialba magadii]ADD05879.1 uncharacterized protein Nmag_2316 [Natrialba magadii ATCC 43099]ELY30613.1 hypothetical protein C500_08837 [Natrialba magadii ATCC 43099]
MSDGSSHSSTRSTPSGRAILGGIGRVIADAILIGAFVLLLTLLFLQTGWPRWVFYAVLFLGVAGYVSITRPW